MKPGLNILNDFLSLFYPNLCLACGENPPSPADILCLRCQYSLPKTDFHLLKENPFTEKFWGRIDICYGAALYYFSKGGKVQKLLHRLKYEGQKNISLQLGKMYGKLLVQSPCFNDIDLIVPIPLHRKKERLRGYNQSDLFAQGLAESMSIAWNNKVVRRNQFTSTQTGKKRTDRFENVGTAFLCRNKELIAGKHLLLVDDVVTSGATLEACGQTLLAASRDVKLSLATIAIAH